MTTPDTDQRVAAAAQAESCPPAQVTRQQPYTPPKILSREPLEAMAAVCTAPIGKAISPCTILGS